MDHLTRAACVSLFALLAGLPGQLEAKNVVILMDGTWNKPAIEQQGKQPGVNTNIAWLKESYLLDDGDTQVIRYVAGLGTEGGKLARGKGGAIGKGAVSRVEKAYDELSDVYEPNDDVSIFGFSRGAATARMLCRKIADKGINGNKKVEIRFLGLFDTVAAFGVPDKNLKAGRVDFDDAANDLTIPENVRHVVHLVSIDEDRAAFWPTLVQCEDPTRTKVDEVWFAGNHGDVGGGWPDEADSPSLSNVTLDYMIRKACERGVKFRKQV